MDVTFTKEDLAFRDEVREFFATQYDSSVAGSLNLATISDGECYKDAIVKWQKKLHAKGWIAPSWPVEYGGAGWSVTQKFIFETERGAAGIPAVIPFGISMVAPVIYTFGNEEQKKKFLPRILSSDDWWCQGYSEPGAGSDLAALSTSADLVDGEYLVNGHKVWTSYAQYADWIFCLVRTSKETRKQQGISFLLIDMKSPGIDVKPIVTIDGPPPGFQEINMVHFEDVKVPVGNLIGDEGKGWTYAKYLLEFERGTAYSHGL